MLSAILTPLNSFPASGEMPSNSHLCQNWYTTETSLNELSSTHSTFNGCSSFHHLRLQLCSTTYQISYTSQLSWNETENVYSVQPCNYYFYTTNEILNFRAKWRLNGQHHVPVTLSLVPTEHINSAHPKLKHTMVLSYPLVLHSYTSHQEN